MDNLGDQNRPTRQTSFSPGSAIRQITPCQESSGEDDGRRVTGNFLPIQVTSGENRHKVSTESEICTSKIISSERDTSENSITHVEATDGFQRDALYIEDVSEDSQDVEATADENYFLENYELQFKSSTEKGAKRYPRKRDPAQKFIRSSKRMSNRGAKQCLTTPKESIEMDEEYWRRDILRRNSDVREYAYEESSLGQEITEAQRQWYRSREMRSKSMAQTNCWLLILALLLTFITAVILVIFWEYLSYFRAFSST